MQLGIITISLLIVSFSACTTSKIKSIKSTHKDQLTQQLELKSKTFSSGATVAIPEGFESEMNDFYLSISKGENLKMYYFEYPSEDSTSIVKQSWEKIGEAPSLVRKEESIIDGWDSVFKFLYEDIEGVRYYAAVYHKEKYSWVFLMKAQLTEIPQNGAAIVAVMNGLNVPGFKKSNLLHQNLKPILSNIESLESFIHQAMKKSEIPGLAISIIEDGKVVLSKGYGVRDLRVNDPVDEDTLFSIGSISKPITSLLMARRVDQGKFDWKTPIKSAYGDFKLQSPYRTETMMMEELLCNCSGISSRDIGLFLSKERSAKETLRYLSMINLGEESKEKQFLYNNMLFSTAGYIMGSQDKTLNAADYNSLLEKELFEPLDMKRSTADYKKALSDSNIATGHNLIQGKYRPEGFDYLDWILPPYSPAGGVFSSVKEMSKLMLLELNEGKINGESFISRENLLHRRKPQVATGSEYYGFYALGWFVGEYKGLEFVHHGGTLGNYEALLYLFPQRKLGIVILTNGEGEAVYSVIRKKIIELWFDTKEGSHIDLEKLAFDSKIEETSFNSNNFLAWQWWFRGHFVTDVSDVELEKRVGKYKNDYAGAIALEKQADGFILNTGKVSIPIRKTTQYATGNAILTVRENGFEVYEDRDKHTYVFSPLR